MSTDPTETFTDTEELTTTPDSAPIGAALEPVRQFYDRIVAYEWERLEHYILEFAIVRAYLDRYLPPPPARILDIGGGPGRYATLLAQRGYDITLLDISTASVTWAQEQFTQLGVSDHARAELGDARDLSRVPTASYDAALVFGPLYHLTDPAERRQTVAEARRIIRSGGALFTMLLTRAAAIYEGFNRWPEGILDRPGVQRLLTTGSTFNFERDPHDFEHVYFATPAEIYPLHHDLNLRTLAVVGCEGMLGGRRDALQRLSPDLQAAWIDLILQVCEDPSLHGAAERLLYVGQAL